MLPTRVDRSNGYAKLIIALPKPGDIQRESDRIAKTIKGRKLGLSDEEIHRKTRPTGNPEKFRQQYGISVFEYEEMLFSQGGKCAICEREETNGRLLATDHDHSTGKVRGLLCRACNTGLGHFGDSIPRLLSALEYLRK